MPCSVSVMYPHEDNVYDNVVAMFDNVAAMFGNV